MNNRGVTLVELLIIMAIAAVLMVVLGFEFGGWKGKYNVEKTIKDVYSSLSNARAKALQSNRAFFFDIAPNGRYYRVSEDESNGVARVLDGDGIFQEQAPWTAAGAYANWGAEANASDNTLTALSRLQELNTNPNGATAIARRAGLLSAREVVPIDSANRFVLGFDKRGIIRDMRRCPSVPLPNILVPDPGCLQGQNPLDLSICIFTDYNNDGVSDTDPDYDCINISDAKIALGKLQMQNTVGALAGLEPCVNTISPAGVLQQVGGRNYGCLSK